MDVNGWSWRNGGNLNIHQNGPERENLLKCCKTLSVTPPPVCNCWYMRGNLFEANNMDQTKQIKSEIRSKLELKWIYLWIKKWYTSDQIRSTFRFTAHHLGNLRERPTASTDFPTFILGHEPSWTWANVDNICERFAHLVHTLTKWERCTWNLQHVTWRRLKKGLGDVW